MKSRVVIGCALSMAAEVAGATDTPLYQPAPDWIAPALPITAGGKATSDADLAVVMVFDSQRRVEKGRVWNYVDTATRMATAEVLAQAGTVSIPWSPDQGDFIVHRMEIVRGSERIDLVKAGQRFSVLRREEGLERRELTGLLTATLPVQGLQVGDILRIAVSVTAADPALKGNVQAIMPMMAAPFRVGQGRARLQWPVADQLKWKVHGEGPLPVVSTAGGYREVLLGIPLPKQPEMPGDAPARFYRSPMLEVGSFAGWSDVSRTMAPLFATDDLIAPATALDREVKAIMAATPDPLGRAQRALELVQDKVRYMVMGMAGGNYTPQAPAKTWELRYGDCKAKTLMLLAMLRAMGIEAEPVLASSGGGDLLPDRLPTPGAFDHVLVRATVGGETLWLDGTRAGTRLADIRDTPALYHVLPLTTAGSALMPVAMRANARPDLDVALEMDESASVQLPSLFKAEIAVRGEMAAMINAGLAQADAKQKRELVGGIVSEQLGQAQITKSAIRYDAATGVATIAASGLITTPWRREDKRYRRVLDQGMSAVSFEPDRARAAWAAIPVRTGPPAGRRFRTRIKLPGGGRGYVLEGDRELSGSYGGLSIKRSATLDQGVVTIDERVDATGAEIAPASVAAERARVSLAKTRLLRAIAPTEPAYRWQLGATSPAARALDAAFTEAIAADPEEVTGYDSRASFRTGVLDRKGAIEDLGRAIAIEPSVDRYYRRANLHVDQGKLDAAIADAEAARKLDPGSASAIQLLADLRSKRGDTPAALALVQERIDLGGSERFSYLVAKAQIQSDGGDAAAGVATLDAAIKDKPGDPALLNTRCWIKGTRELALDTALKDCTKAIELSDDPTAALDSRAMVYFRMGRLDDALADLNAALDASPGQAGSLFLRGVVLRRMGQTAPGDADLKTARALSPDVDATYKLYGIAS